MHDETNTLRKTDKGNRWREIVIVVLAVLLLISLSLLVVNKYIFINGGIVEPQFVIPEANGQVFDGMLPRITRTRYWPSCRKRWTKISSLFGSTPILFLPPTAKAAICALRTPPAISTACRPS